MRPIVRFKMRLMQNCLKKSQAVLGLFMLSCTIDCYDNYIQNVIFSSFLLKTNDLQNLYIQQVTI